MPKAVAIPYIVALILAVIVIVLIGYFMFFKGGLFGGVASEQECRGYEFYYCGLWSKGGYTTKPTCKVNNQDKECGFKEYYKQCESYGWANEVNEQECKKMIGQRT